MKVQRTEGRFHLHLSAWEKRLLFELLRLYPRSGSPRKSAPKPTHSPDLPASERLLQETLTEQRKENKKLVQAFLADPSRFQDTKAGTRLSLSQLEVEWFLQLLNDIRIGSWVLLGSPEEKRWHLDPETAPHLFAMEMSGYFESQLLEALEGDA
ncbi:conserved hypothetical protein [Verrucomicrobia bacterium]|nr:conserved hypothetical protein [Verrucomicrobiota bacterium]